MEPYRRGDARFSNILGATARLSRIMLRGTRWLGSYRQHANQPFPLVLIWCFSDGQALLYLLDMWIGWIVAVRQAVGRDRYNEHPYHPDANKHQNDSELGRNMCASRSTLVRQFGPIFKLGL